ncbi:ABC transporter ATP-binding protein [Mesorhizobium sp. BAC0120]|uniref:ABC transporter ATP-binding protein n=1 Tax=Mesorhizobium sp. BAC0120 TaxID=3090670 RepID=UPI00298C5A35|nr:ABC transporter ATP-binding protein [Mesorhizobium sp. BAC0120]MDW6023512.1 ABC transporter ATP-binding protein [Mesorhizobium sp. BAC0120]
MADPSSNVLSVRALVAGYERDLPIVRGVDFSVSSGEFVVILGPNGAGKSTFVKAIAGLVPIHSGSAALGSFDITNVAAHDKIRHGLAFVPQTENIFATLSISDNLQLAADILPRGRRGTRIAEIYSMFPDLAARPSLRAGQLSGGQRQMLAVARALVVDPSVLILDEPSAGLSPKIVSEVFSRLKAINQANVTVVLVEQNVKAALAIADRAVILVEGRVRHEGPAASLADDPVVAELYLGARREGEGARP